MRRFVAAGAVAVVALFALAVIGIGMVLGWPVLLGPKARSLSARQFDRGGEMAARGEYLVEGVFSCMKCHSPLDTAIPGAPALVGMNGAGAIVISDNSTGVVVASNLTPDEETGLGRWTDDQIARAIREGISHDGRALFPMMPYQNYREMSDDDLAAVVAYLRSLPPVRNQLPKTMIAFPVRYLIRPVPRPVMEPVAAHYSSIEERGRYLVKQASCANCHSPFDDRHEPLAGLDLAGGNIMQEHGIPEPATIPNITADATGIGHYSPEKFREVMRTGLVGSRRLHSLMPSSAYRRMNDEDLDAMFAYLRTVTPQKHWISGTAKPAFCPVCNKEHGFGEMNQPVGGPSASLR
jgi:mono/diheme cytochrome c family protein